MRMCESTATMYVSCVSRYVYTIRSIYSLYRTICICSSFFLRSSSSATNAELLLLPPLLPLVMVMRSGVAGVIKSSKKKWSSCSCGWNQGYSCLLRLRCNITSSSSHRNLYRIIFFLSSASCSVYMLMIFLC